MKKKMEVLLGLAVFVAIAVVITIIIANPTTASCGDSTRLKYFGNYFEDCEFQRNLYSQLPPMPDDFEVTRNTFLYKYVTFNDKVLNKSYWIQPEWYPNYNKLGGAVEAIKSYDGKGITLWSAGIYPSDFFIRTIAGRNLTLYTWVSNVPHQWKYEGIELKKVYPKCDSYEEMGFDLGNNTVCQNPDYVREHIEIIMTPDLFIVTPTYPEYTNNYRKIIQVDVSISNEIKPGRYVLGFNIDNPPEDFNMQYYSMYGFGYTGSPREFHVASPAQYRLFMEVEKYE